MPLRQRDGARLVHAALHTLLPRRYAPPGATLGGRGEAPPERSASPADKAGKNCDFAQVLKRSICLEQNTQAWCDNCEKYQPTVSAQRGRTGEAWLLMAAPPILAPLPL